jgi:hypothetical protein
MTGCLAFGVLSALEQPLPTRQQRFPVGLAVVAEPCCTGPMEPRQRATEMLSVLLGISRASTENLFDLASQVLGPSRTERCLDLSRLARLSRRWAATAAVAEFIAGTRLLGQTWWERPHLEMVIGKDRGAQHRVIRWEDRGTPDAYLARPQPPDHGVRGPTILESVGYWIQDDTADHQWGRPVDYVDLNDPAAEDRIILPADAKPGNRFVASFDPGSRVWVDIVQWDQPDPRAEERGNRRGLVGSKLGEHDICDVSDAGWAWSVAIDVGPVHLPGEEAGGASDPFAEQLDPGVASQLWEWATSHEDDASKIGNPWRTKADLWSARFRLGLPWHRNGNWHLFDQASRAAVDGDLTALQDAIAKLR